MHTLGGTSNFPWWRVLNNKGSITIKEDFEGSPQIQQQLLEEEGIEFSSKRQLDMEKYRYHPDGETYQVSLLD